MKDYKLSEIKTICKKNKGDCEKCKLSTMIKHLGLERHECDIIGDIRPFEWQKPYNWQIDEEEKR